MWQNVLLLSYMSILKMFQMTFFTDGSETAVNTLTDVFVDHLSTICKLFKFTVENQPGNANNLENLFVSSTEFLAFVFPKKKLLRVVLCR